MTILVTGGGSGGHITPVLAVADALKTLQPGVQIVYVGQTGDRLGDIPANDPNIDQAYSVQAGKLRRYHGEGIKQLFDIKTILLNSRDGFRVVRGILEAYRLLKRLKPDVIFIKGGFVGVPVGLAAAWLHIPFVTHDSDAIPGLANRIIARWAKLHTVALPKEVYRYPADKTVSVGVPTHAQYQPVNAQSQAVYRNELGLGSYDPMLLVTGGGLGARRLNRAMVTIAPELFRRFPGLAIVHTAGRANEASLREAYMQNLPADTVKQVLVLGYSNELYRYSAAADLVVMRAGATAIAECAVQGKACVLVPNPYLTGGHQLKNARVLVDQDAVKIVDDASLTTDRQELLETISSLLRDDPMRTELAARLQSLAHIDSARELGMLLLKVANAA